VEDRAVWNVGPAWQAQPGVRFLQPVKMSYQYHILYNITIPSVYVLPLLPESVINYLITVNNYNPIVLQPTSDRLITISSQIPYNRDRAV